MSTIEHPYPEGTKLRIRLTPSNSAVEEEQETFAAVQGYTGPPLWDTIEYYCETYQDAPNWFTRELERQCWVGWIKEEDILGVVCEWCRVPDELGVQTDFRGEQHILCRECAEGAGT